MPRQKKIRSLKNVLVLAKGLGEIGYTHSLRIFLEQFPDLPEFVLVILHHMEYIPDVFISLNEWLVYNQCVWPI